MTPVIDTPAPVASVSIDSCSARTSSLSLLAYCSTGWVPLFRKRFRMGGRKARERTGPLLEASSPIERGKHEDLLITVFPRWRGALSIIFYEGYGLRDMTYMYSSKSL